MSSSAAGARRAESGLDVSTPFAGHRDFWLGKMQAEVGASGLPLDAERTGVFPARMRLCRPLPQQVFSPLSEIAQGKSFLILTSILAATCETLRRYNDGESVVVVGTAARLHGSAAADCPCNALPIITSAAPLTTYKQLLGATRAALLEAFEFQDYPFSSLLEELALPPTPGRCPIFDVAVAMRDLQLPLPPLENDLTVDISREEDGIVVELLYNPSILKAQTVQSFWDHVTHLLAQALARPDVSMAAFPLLEPGEAQRQEVRLRGPAPHRSSGALLHHAFEALSREAPDRIALLYAQMIGGPDIFVTYGQLNERADQIAQRLARVGVAPGAIVAVSIRRSVEMIVALLGVLKAGAAYVPDNLDYPSDMRQHLLTDSGAAAMLLSTAEPAQLPGCSIPVVFVDQCDVPLENPVVHVACQPWPRSIAYLIYTSGTTGRPKGVMVEHAAAQNLAVAQTRAFGIGEGSRVLQFASLSFDASVSEIFTALGSGATLCIGGDFATAPGPLLTRFLQERCVTVATLSPSLLAAMSGSDFPALHTLVSAGEACTAATVERWGKRTHRLINAYGPTEATVCATLGPAREGNDASCIGSPIVGAHIHVLDPHQQHVAPGTMGELYIGGLGVARGYLGHPELTARSFVPDPFCGQAGALMYRTGDRVTLRKDLSLEFIGRADGQVKIRGIRIELPWLEKVLAEHTQVGHAAVIACDSLNNKTKLAACVIPRTFGPASTSGEQAHIASCRTMFDELYGQAETNEKDDPSFDTTGWRNSYTGDLFDNLSMRQWVDDAVSQVIALHPQRVLEIGAGTGLLAFRIAPHCQHYAATDLSSAALAFLRRRFRDAKGANALGIELHHREAKDLSVFQPCSLDCVILNSVLQYFPGVDYLLHVLDGAVRVVRDGGTIFIGDVRSLPLLDAFCASVEMFRASPGMSVRELRNRVRRRAASCEELLVDPRFFTALRQRLPRIVGAQILPKRSTLHNELTSFRYEVLLKIGERPATTAEPEMKIEWRPEYASPKRLHSLVRTMPVDRCLRITNIPNARVWKDVTLLKTMRSTHDSQSVSALREQVARCDIVAIEPWEMAASLKGAEFVADIDWSGHGGEGHFDLLCRRFPFEQAMGFSDPRNAPSLPWQRFTNSPARVQRDVLDLEATLKEYLRKRLPPHMVPSKIVVCESFPLTPHGKLDRDQLAEQVPWDAFEPYRPPRDDVEALIAEVWREVLGLDRVGADDDFFAIGGHSLLAAQSMIRLGELVGEHFPLRMLFDCTTVAKLAAKLRCESADPAHLERVAQLARQVNAMDESEVALMLQESSGEQFES